MFVCQRRHLFHCQHQASGKDIGVNTRPSAINSCQFVSRKKLISVLERSGRGFDGCTYYLKQKHFYLGF